MCIILYITGNIEYVYYIIYYQKLSSFNCNYYIIAGNNVIV